MSSSRRSSQPRDLTHVSYVRLLHWQMDSSPLAPHGIQHKVIVIFGSFSSSAVRKKRLLTRNVTYCISNSNDMSPTVVAALSLPFSAAC